MASRNIFNTRLSRRGFLTASAKASLGLGALLAGCAPQPSTPTAGAPASAPAAPKAAATTSGPLRPIVFHRSAFRPDLFAKYLTIFNDKYKENATFDGVPSNYASVTETRIQGGQVYDLVMADEGYLGKWYALGWLKALDGFPGADTHKKNMTPVIQEAMTATDGKLIGLPAWATVRTFFYNEEILSKAKLQPAKTWEELYDQCKKMKTDGISQAPFVPMWTKSFNVGAIFFLTMCLSNGVSSTDLFDAKNVAKFDSNPVILDMLKFSKKMFKEGLTPPDILSIDHNATLNIYATGNSAYFMFNDHHLPPLNDATKSKAAGKVKPMLWPGKTHTSQAAAQAYAMMSNSAEPDRAWRLLTFLAGEIEGKYPVAKDMMAIELGYSWGYNALFGDADIEKEWSKWAKPDDLKVFKEQAGNAKTFGAVVNQPWFADWLVNLNTQMQSAIAGDVDEEKALKESGEFARGKAK